MPGISYSMGEDRDLPDLFYIDCYSNDYKSGGRGVKILGSCTQQTFNLKPYWIEQQGQ